MLCNFMRERFHYFVWALVLALVFSIGCSKPKPPEAEKTETAQPSEPAQAPTPAPTTPETPAPPVEPAAVTPPPEEKPVEKTESLWDRIRSPIETPPPAPPKQEPLHVYYQKDSIPEAWCEAWTAESHVSVVQTKFTAGGAIPADGDIYLFTPSLFSQVVAGPGALHLDAGWARAGLDPMFTGQPFDVNNAQSRPWRWTPYLIYGASARTAPWKDRRLSDLWADPKALWPDDLTLLTGMALKDEKISANPRNKESWTSTYHSTEGKLHGKTATEEECWRKLQAGEIELTLLPASVRLKLPADQTALLAWGVPQNGTLIYFEQISIGEHTKQKDRALAFVDHLLKVDQQKRLLAETGYFSVRIKPGSEAQQGGMNFPKKDWLDLSEFLMEVPLPPNAVEAVAPAVTPVVGPAPETAASSGADPAKVAPAPEIVPAEKPATPQP